MVNSKSYLSTSAEDRIIELSWQPVNWILVKPGEGGGFSERKLEGYNTDNICQKWEMCHFHDRHRHRCSLTGDILFAKRWFHKTQDGGEPESEIPCFIPGFVVNRWMQAKKTGFYYVSVSPSRHKHQIYTLLDLTQVIFPSLSPKVIVWRQPF